MVRLSDLRLRPRPVGRDRAGHPFDLHARVRGPPAALRLADRAPPGPVAPSPVRVRPAESHVHGPVQAVPAPARDRRARARLGRSAHADDLRAAPARLPGRGHPPLRHRGRRRQVGQRPRDGPPRALGARRPEPDAPSAGSPSSTRSRWSSRTTRKARSRSSTSRTTRRIPRRARGACRSAGSCGSSATTSWRSRRRSSIRLAPGREVRLRAAYFVTCTGVVKDESGRVVELRCTYDPATRGGDAPDGRRPKATLHWLSAAAGAAGRGPAVRVPVHAARPRRGRARPARRPQPRFRASIDGRLRRAVAREARVGETVQFERLGYFCADVDSAPGALVFNRTITLKDTWAKIQAKGDGKERQSGAGVVVG